MTMIHCPNCGKLTGFKRSLGFGTLFMVLLTFGLWLLVIPFYPARCINCGLTRNSAVLQNIISWYGRRDTRSKVIAAGVLVLALLLLIAHTRAPQPTAPVEAPQAQQPSTNAPQSIQKTMNEPKQEPALTSHQRRLAALREKREGIEMAMAVEQETIAKILREEGPQGVPEGEHQRAQRLVQEKEAIDAAIEEEEQAGGSEPEPSAPTVLQTLPHHQVGETFSVGYWTYRCDGMRWSQFLGNGSSQAGRSETGFAVIYLTMRNDDDSPSIVPPIKLIDSDAHEYDTSPKALLQRDALDLTARLDAKASAQGSVIFEVPQGGTYFFEVSGGMMSTQLALVDLKPGPQSGEPSQTPTQTPSPSKFQPGSHANQQPLTGDFGFGPQVWKGFAFNPQSADDYYDFDSNPKNILQGAVGQHREHTVMVWTRHHSGGRVVGEADIGINCSKKQYMAIDVQKGSVTQMQPITNPASPVYLLYKQVCEPSASP